MQDHRFEADFLPARVAHRATLTPQAPALVDAEGTVDWATLWAWSGRLAAALTDTGVRPGERIALALPRSAALVASILAVWRVRCSYVPLDPALPAARLRWQAEDCDPLVAIADDASTASWLPDGVRTLAPSALRASPMDATRTFAADLADGAAFAWPAYVIYTSGSSGRPKGVVLSHRALAAYLRGVGERLPDGIRSAAYLSTPTADLGHTALFGALWHGWTLHLIDPQVAADPDAFADYMHAHDVDLLKIVPSHLAALMQARVPEAVLPARCLVIGGEAAPTRLAERISQMKPACVLINHYGPTETAVGVLTRSGADSRAASLPLGLPLAHVTARIVDADGNSVPRGTTGELCIGGASLADGYWNRPSLTAERFVPDAEGNGARIYRTGDRSRRLPGGEYAFLGRIDDQVKIRGFRVEPEEIAARLRQLPGVRDAIVIARAEAEGAPLRLLGYVAASVPLDGAALRAVLVADLPDHMVPSSIRVLEVLPLTANGKIDRAALPAEDAASAAAAEAPGVTASARVEPRNDAERLLAEVWKQALRRDDFGVTDNFFEIGGDSILSLQIIAKARRAGLKLTPKQMFEHPTIEAAARIAQPMAAAAPPAAAESPRQAASASASPAALAAVQPGLDDEAWFVEAGVTRETVDAVYPATPMQQGLLFHGMLGGVPGLYVGQLRLTLDALRVDEMRRAWQTVVARHPVLRTRFHWPAGGEPLQIVERRVDMPFDLHATAELTASAYAAHFAAARDGIAASGFDVARAPLMRVDVFSRADGGFDLLWTHHHALTDGWSTAQVLADVAQAYGAIVAGRQVDATPGLPYANYVQWLRRQPDTGDFWRARLASLDDPARLADALGPDFHPAVPPSTAGQAKTAERAALSAEPGRLTRELDAARHAALRQAARRARVTLNTLVQGAWALVLSRFSGRAQVVFGTTVSGRPADLPEAQQIVGLFINSLPLWTDVEPDAAVDAWLLALQGRNAALREVEHTPLAALREWTGLAGDALFDSLVVFENYPLEQAVHAANAVLDVRAVDASDRTHLPLTLVVAPRGAAAGLTMQWCWDATRIETDGVARLARHVDAALDRIAAALNAPAAADAQPSRVRDIALDVEPSSNASPAQFVFEPALSRIAAQFDAQPDAVALMYPQPGGAVSTLTYRELQAGSARIGLACAAAMKRAGFEGERRIGIAMRRTPALVAAILGVLRAGAAYVPLDPEYPDERLRDIALDAGLDAIVTTDAEHARFTALVPAIELIDAADASEPDANAVIDRAPHPEQLAYVIYTSGSTGRPKGVGITHANLARLFAAGDRCYAFGPSDVWPLLHSYAFDVSVWEVFGALIHGGRLLVVPHDIARDAPALQRLLHEQRVTVLNQTPSAFMPLCEIDAQLALRDPSATMAALRYVVFAGEKLDPPALAKWFVGREESGVPPPWLVNMYGITETTVHVTFRRLGRADIVRAEAPSAIGGPLADLTLSVLDPFGEPVPIGAAGELHVGGAGLARGYLGRPGLTASRFVPDPAGPPGSRLYRSGDTARRLASGDIDYLGRNDSQMKVRGFRIEAGEVESALRAHPDVGHAVVLVRDQRLVAWVVPATGQPLAAAALRAFVAQALPAHMVPSAYVLLDKLPVTQNGKLDRRALPVPEERAATAPYVAPRDATEAALALVWQQVLGVERVGVQDDFFLRGGHSLLAVRVIAAIRATFGRAPTLRTVFERPVLADLAAAVREAVTRPAAPAVAAVPADSAPSPVAGDALAAPVATVTKPAVPEDATLPLSAGQARLWFLWKLDPDSAAYLINGALQLEGALDTRALAAALDALVERHPALRLRFGESQGVPRQTIGAANGAANGCALRVVDLCGRPDADLDLQLAGLARAPFDLTADPPLRVTLLRTAAQRHVLHLVLHHIVGDDWSVRLLFADFARMYRRAAEGAPLLDMTRLAADRAYLEALHAQAARLADGRDATQLAYWREELGALPGDGSSDGVLALPCDRSRSGARQAQAARCHVRVPAAVANALRRWSRERRATLFMTLLAAFNALLYRYTGQRDIRIGVPLAGRDAPGVDEVVGFFVNTVVIRTTLDGTTRVDRLVDEVRERLLAAHANQDVPFASVVSALQVERNLAQTPLFQVLVNHQQRNDFSTAFGDSLHATPRHIESGEAQFDLMLNIVETTEGGPLDLTLTFARDVFEPATIDRLAGHFVGLLAQWSAAPKMPHAPTVASFVLAEHARESDSVPAVHAVPAVHDATDATDVVSRFIRQAARRGDDVAISDGAARVSYAQLDAWSRAIAAELRRRGAGTETRVGVAMQRSAGLVAALLGVLRAGAAYVPLDPSYPGERLAHIVGDAQLGGVVGDAASLALHAALFDAHETLDADALRDAVPAPGDDSAFREPHREQLAYVIYTSGSTGLPKGVGVTHRNLARLFDATTPRFAFDERDVWTLFHSYAFDFSVWELFGALTHGGRLVIVPHWTARDPAAFHRLLRDEQVSVLNQTPSAFSQLVRVDAQPSLDSLRIVIFGGERLDPAALLRWADGARERGVLPRLVNMYGITETTVHVTQRELDGAALRDARSVIGAPLDDLSLHVLDADLNRVPLGATGEMHVGGAGLSRGYLGRAALTAERFVPDPFGAPGARLYRSGDLARRLPDGDLEYLGRNDHQLKIRGFRIEPGEIQAALRAHPDIRDAAVLALETPANDPRLVAYLVPADTATQHDPERWRAWLSTRLPAHMVPSSFVALERFPLTPNGKLDRRALPAPETVAVAAHAAVAASTEAEEKLLDVWRRVLRRDDIGVTDNFFVIGGDSILSLQIVAKARDSGLRLTPRQIFEEPTVARLAKTAQILTQATASLRPDDGGTETGDLWRALGVTPEHIEDVYPATPLQTGLLYHALSEPGQRAYVNQLRLTLSGPLDRVAMQDAWQAALDRHAVLRTRFEWQRGSTVSQIVHRRLALPFAVHDWSAATDCDVRLAQWRERDLAAGIAPDVAPLMRAALFIRDARTADLVWTHHHLLLDGWSVAQLLGEILRDYRARAGGSQPAGARFDAAPPYRRYVQWLQQASDEAATEAWWRTRAAQVDEPATLTPSLGAPAHVEPGAHAERRALAASLGARLVQAARHHEVTLNTLMQGAWAIVLARYGHRRGIAYGTTLAGRPADLPGVEQMLGLFVNTLPVWVDVDPHALVGDWLRTLQSELTALRQHEHTPLARVQQWTGRSGDALFDSLVVFENYPVDPATRAEDGELRVSGIESIDPTHYPLALSIIPRERISLEWSWKGERIDRATIDRLSSHYEEVLEQLAGSGVDRVGDLRLSVPTGSLLRRCAFASLPEALSARAACTPDAVAVRCEGEVLSHAQLDAWSGAVAARLIRRGVRAETRVGLCVARGPALLAALLGVIRAGGAFVPLDPEYPAARLSQMIDDAGIVQVLADDASAARLADLLAGCAVVPVSFDGASGEAPVATLHPDQLAYVLYTSGSTGRPKGVAVSHGALWTHLQDFLATYRITSADTVLHSSTLNFDVALHETLPALLSGATVEMRGVQPWDLQSLSERLVERQVTFARIPTALWQQWQRSAPPRASLALRQVTVGGEALPGDALARWKSGPLADIRLDNLYGPTETTIAALYRQTLGEDGQQITVPIGKPYPGRTARVIDAFGDAAPAGGLGELCIGGPTVARGYLGRAALTAERFVPDPHGEPGARQYRSGDLCRMRADGTVEFLGRLDQQVKLRGQRIELGEIEALLRQCAGVREAAVIVTGEGETQRLAGYVAGEVEARALLRALEQRLPASMVPSSLTVLERLPALPNGKLDRAALPAPQAAVHERVEPRDATEATLLSIWSAVLGRDDLGVTENFFEAGGDSIQSLQIIARARQAGLKLTPRQVFEHPTVERLALRVQALDDTAQAAPPRTGALPLTPIQRGFFERHPQGESHWNQSVLLKVEGRLDVQALERALVALNRRHDALRLRFLRTEDGWRQQVSTAPEAVEIYRETLPTLDALAAAGQRVQSSLSLTDGPLWRVGCFETQDGRQTRLLIAIHHLAVDGVSWRVLLEELQLAYAQAEQAAEIVLPTTSTPWSAWVQKVHDHARTPEVQAEAAVWQRVSDALDAAQLPLGAPSNTRIADSETIEWTLDAGRTRELLQTVPRAYRTRTDELLLAALAQSLGAWSGLAEIAIELEGHGREDVIEGVDLSRTVGWFTTRFPVTLPSRQVDPGAALVAVKERLRAVPHKGMHWGWLDAARGERRPAVSFNYLGRFDQSFDEDARFAFSDEHAGSGLGDAVRLDYALDLNGLVTGDELVLRWRFDPARIDRATVQRLVAAFDRHVLATIAHCVAAAPGASASDFPLSGLDQAQLQGLGLDLGGVADIYPATPLQQGLLYHGELQQGQGVYVNQLQLTLRGPLDADAMRDAWQAAVTRHEMLRTRFEWRHGGDALQIVERHAALPFAVHDWRHVSGYDARLSSWRQADLAAGIEPARAPLMRLNLFRRPDGGHDLVRTHHHVLIDGWSGARLFAEVLDDYARRTRPRPGGFVTDAALASPPPPPYRRYVEWLAKQPDPRQWWLARIADSDDAATLTGSLAAPPTVDAAAPHDLQQKFIVTLDAALDERVRRAAQRHQVTLNTLMQGAWAVLLARLGGTRSVAFGVTVSGRPASLPGSEAMFGLFINSLPVFIGVPGDATVRDWLRTLQDYNTQLREVEHTPLASLQQWAGRSGDALFDSLIVFENYPVAAGSEPPTRDGLRIDGVDAVERTHYPLTLTILPLRGLDLHWGWDSRRLARVQVEQLQRQYVALLEQLSHAGDATRCIGDLAVLPRDRAQPEALPAHAFEPVHARFERQAARTPQRIAVSQGDTTLDYASLASWVSALDARLRESGVAREERVGVCMRRSPALLASMFAVWRSGGCYVPLDPVYPLGRLEHMLADAGIRRVLTDAEGAARLGELLDGRIAIDAVATGIAARSARDAAQNVVAPMPLRFLDQQLAYVLYTSGSTGRPKGVCVPHGALDRLIASVGRVPGLGADDVLLSVTTASFDISLLEFCLPLVTGARIELADSVATGDGAALARLIDTRGATAMQATPSGWRLLLEAGWNGPASGRLLGLAGGEPLSGDLADALLARGVELWNLYGPTETTIWSSCGAVQAHAPVTIGRALHATTLRVVDANGQPTPSGGTGELCIGGENVARGYLGRPGLTAERFVPHPAGAPGARMYRTGDLCRERPDQTFDCLGRIDQQVKLRGHRIEPGEIEAVLRACDGVIAAAVTLVNPSDDAQARLVGCVVTLDGALPAGWRRTLAERLPAHMIPAALHSIDALPRTANGKLDRHALARIGAASDAPSIEAATESERLVAALFGEVLGIARVDAHDDFFALGGHSLAVVRVTARLSERLGRKIELASVFSHPTPAALGALLDADGVSAGAGGDADMQALDDLFDALD